MAATEKIRVLIVDDVPETRENIRKLLQFEGDVEVVGAARTGREAISIAEETKPDVVLMDINMPDMDGIEATEAIRRKVSFSQIIILSVQADPSYMRKAMLVGARDFLTKPPVIDELNSAIRRAGVMAHEEKIKAMTSASQMAGGSVQIPSNGVDANGNVIVVYSPKGGTGCTTIATNLALSLRSPESKVALIDGNLQFGDIAVFLNVQGKNTILDLATRVDDLDPDIVHEVMVDHGASGVHILAAPSRPEMADKVTADQFNKILQFMRQLYDFIVVDTSSYLSEIVLAAMDIADLLVLVTTQDIPAIKNTKTFLSLIDGMHINRQRLVFVLNQYDKRIAITPEKISESLRQEVVGVIPLDERTVVSAVNRGVPFVMDNKTQPVSRSVLSLAELVRDRVNKFEVPELDKVLKR